MRNEPGAGSTMARLPPQPRGTRREPQAVRERARIWVAWLALIGLIIPAAEVQVFIGGAKFTVGRIGIFLLLIPAVVTLLQKNRRLLLSDLLVCAMAVWIVGANFHTEGTKSLSSAGAEAIEF